MATVPDVVVKIVKRWDWLRDLPRSQLLTLVVAFLWLGSGLMAWWGAHLDAQWYAGLEVFTGGVVVHYGASKVAEVKIAHAQPPPGPTAP
jgi:hypothetical protein